MFDVGVIGAGPAGSMVARLLSEKGYRVALLEEHEQAGAPVNCSGIIGVEAFDRFDLPEEYIKRSIDRFRFFSPGGAEFEYVHSTPLAFAVDRAGFDIGMAARAVAHGTVLMTGSRVNDIRIEKSAVYLTVNHRQTLSCRYVVIATGAGSKLTKLIGLGTPQRYTLGAQTECEARDLTHVEIHLGRRIAPSNFAWLIPLGPNRVKVGLLCDTSANTVLKRFLASQAANRAELGPPGPIQCSLLPLDTIPRSFTDRTLVIGEAAGQIKTITCGGIYYALLAAEIAASVLDSALRKNRPHATYLSVYEKRWKKLFLRELQTGLQLRSVFERLTDEAIDHLFTLVRHDGIPEMVRSKVNFDWHRDLVMAVFRHSLIRGFMKPRAYAQLLA